MDIRLYRASGTYRIAFRARTISFSSVSLTVPETMTSEAEPSTILTIPSFFTANNLLNSSFWEYTWTVLPESKFSLYFEKCCFQYKKPLILWCQYPLLRLSPQLAPSSSVTLSDTCSYYNAPLPRTRLWWRTYAGRKCPHVCMLSLSTGNKYHIHSYSSIK